MKLFKQILPEAKDASLFQKVRALKNTAKGKWSISENLEKFRTRLLDLQSDRCVYCQSLIELDEGGYRELDHVLPKKASPKCNPIYAKSNEQKRRKSTLGYPQFMFEPKNLVVTCKQCNTQKGTYDGLLNRNKAGALVKYPHKGAFEWMHPWFHTYSDHIDLTPNFVFKGRTDAGRAVIHACKLDKTAILEKKFLHRAKVRVRQFDTLL